MEKESAKVTNITMTPGRNPLMEPVDPRYYNGKELAEAAVPLEIRLNQPGHIVEKRGQLLPRRHNLVTKRTVRCKHLMVEVQVFY